MYVCLSHMFTKVYLLSLKDQMFLLCPPLLKITKNKTNSQFRRVKCRFLYVKFNTGNGEIHRGRDGTDYSYCIHDYSYLKDGSFNHNIIWGEMSKHNKKTENLNILSEENCVITKDY